MSFNSSQLFVAQPSKQIDYRRQFLSVESDKRNGIILSSNGQSKIKEKSGKFSVSTKAGRKDLDWYQRLQRVLENYTWIQVKMSTSKIVIMVVAAYIGCVAAKPIAESSSAMHTDHHIAYEKLAGQISERQARRAYYFPYDYYYGGGLPFDSTLYSDYYQPSNYIGTDYFYQQPVHRPSRRRDSRPFGPTTQKYTVWDLA